MSSQKVWFITGASRGFGLEIAKAALAEGNKVVATVRSKPEQLAAQLDNNENLIVTVLDVTDETQALDAAKQATDTFGRIDVLVNNAGYGLLSAVEEASNEEVKQNYDANVFGLLNVTRAILPYMRKQRSGHIINISSVGGLNGFVGWGIYGSTKFAVEGITESMALELAPLGIYATVVAPGFFRTEFLDPTSLIRTAHVIEDYAGTVGEMRSFATQVNKKQPGDPKKLAQAFIKLANAEKPPVHLPLGNDTLAMYREKTAKFEKDIEDWYDVISGTDHDDVRE
ncbi:MULTISPECIES: oxidoreductase [unclassified Paenibacillus]|uniref:oxidoreductase n=1 Tax=unclassified Paenibacillus TaxID=185978 RepID=UPI00278B8EB5|nr:MULTISPECIES: oxidoreductase [unclassified Paenibacillus]MDQ0902238.1 NAD(P)-dependent dehydrogenase (short-subunit alcohol dehydrogenase family) [Paenibacillus sp. V4I7]MDQ0919265.1 NAD(P)-dependent dehydrogenase (short-subunit alcohol dehydrogenase family) [Paenibacillus sp. V4I5]